MAGARSAPTGCYKCGRPGHWSRDCPSSSAAPSASENPDTSSFKTTASASSSGSAAGFKPIAAPKPKKVAKSRPKLTPELLISDDGLCYVLRYFPRAFKYRGRGYEERDLGNLIRLYEEWHSQLLPYYPFDQFVHRVEQVAASKRVKTVSVKCEIPGLFACTTVDFASLIRKSFGQLCTKELCERVANGGDLTKLHERPVEQEDLNMEQGAMQPETTDDDNHQADPISEDHHADDTEDMLNEIYQQATGDINSNTVGTDGVPTSSKRQEALNQGANRGLSCPDEASITEEQRAHIEANKQHALEKAACSSSAQANMTEEQRARMEVNRLKALERVAAARARSMQAIYCFSTLT